jgi:hypothetical protein
MTKAVSFLVLLGLAAMPALAAVETYNDVPVVDVNCSKNSPPETVNTRRFPAGVSPNSRTGGSFMVTVKSCRDFRSVMV